MASQRLDQGVDRALDSHPNAIAVSYRFSNARDAAKLLGSTLTVDSQLGVGTTFSLRLPRHPDAAETGNSKSMASLERSQSWHCQ